MVKPLIYMSNQSDGWVFPIFPNYGKMSHKIDFTPIFSFGESSWHPVQARGFFEEGFPNDRSEPRQRHNLATRVMSNGVEVIVANDKEVNPAMDTKMKLMRIMTQENEKITLAPSTLKNNVRMTVAMDQARKNQSTPFTQPNPRQQSLLSSSMSTNFEPFVAYHHQNSEVRPLQHRHNYVIKTCYTTFTYLTTTVQKMRTLVSTYETVVSTITTEPIELSSSSVMVEVQPTQAQLFQATKTISTPILQPKIEKRIDELQSNYDLDDIQPSETTHSCSMTSCPCTVTLTESLKDNLKTKLNEDVNNDDVPLQLKRSPMKPTKYSSTIIDITPTVLQDYKKENKHKNKIEVNKPTTQPSDKIVQKYTEIISEVFNEPSKKNDKNKLPATELEKNSNKRNNTKSDDKNKNKEPVKVNKNKFEVADLFKLGIKRLAPMIQKMTGDLIKQQNKTTTTIKPATKITPYIVNKRHDIPAISDQKPSGSGQFPIYIPVDEKDIEAAESQNVYYNSTLQQSLAWNAQTVKNSRNNLIFSKPIHESPLVNGGIPISPGEIITANSDVIVGKPADGGPNIRHINKPNNNKAPPPNYYADSHIQSSNVQDVRAKPPQREHGIKQIPFIREDDTYDLRPPMLAIPRPPQVPHENKGAFNPPPPPQHDNKHHQGPPQGKPFNLPPQQHDNRHHQSPPLGKPFNLPPPQHENKHHQGPPPGSFNQQSHDNQKHQNLVHPGMGFSHDNQNHHGPPPGLGSFNSQMQQHQQEQPRPHSVFVDHVGGSIHTSDSILENHGRPAFLDYIPALDSPATYQNYVKNNLITRKTHDDQTQQNILDKSKVFPSKLQQDNKIAQTQFSKVTFDQKSSAKPFLVDIQPSRVANVIIPHGSTTALIFAGSSEPHKNGEYIDDPLPYQEPGYFGSFSIDAPHLTSVHVGGTIPLSNTQINEKPPMNPHKNPDPHIVNHGNSGLNKDVHLPLGQRWKYEESSNKPSMFQVPPKLPPPVSNQESNLHFGPHFAVNPNGNNIEFGTNPNVPPPIRNQKFNNIRTTTEDYEADLAVPPPPPTVQVKFESNVGVLNTNTNKFNGNNEQHHFNRHNENAPPKITSEIYFATQKAKPNKHSSQQAQSHFENSKFVNTFDGGLVTLNAGTRVNIPNVQNAGPPPPPNFNIKPNPLNNNYNVPQGGGLITLNAGASVFNPNLPEQTISGTSIPQKTNTINSHTIKEFNSQSGESTGIPIGTNFAIKVEPQLINEYNSNPIINGASTNFKPQDKGPEIIIGGNSWKVKIDDSNKVNGIPDSVLNGNQKVHVVHARPYVEQEHFNKDERNGSGVINSHANFPVMKEHAPSLSMFGQITNVGPNGDNVMFGVADGREETKRPSALDNYKNYYENRNISIQQRPVVLHSSSVQEVSIQHHSGEQYNKFSNKLPNIKIESTTHKIIPLTFNYEGERYGAINNNVQFGQKIQSAGMPPTNYNWHESRPILPPKDQKKQQPSGFLSQFMTPPPTLTTTSYNPAYIPTNYNSNRQPVYNIPTKNVYEVTKPTPKPVLNTTKYTTTQNNYISTNDYKTIDESGFNQREPGEYSQGSAKVPIRSSTPHTLTNEVTVNFRPFKNITRPSELLISSGNEYVHFNIDQKKTAFNADHNIGSQTERPFDQNKYRETTQTTLSVPHFSQLPPRPFSPSEHNQQINNNYNVEIHKPRPFQKKPAEDKLILNIGEVPAKPQTSPATRPIIMTEKPIQSTTQKLRPQLSIKQNTLTFKNEIDKIITSSINLSTNKPFKVVNITTEKTTSTLPTFTIDTSKKVNDTLITNMSPPPTIDYNFKPTSSDNEAILGMSPPPKVSTKPTNQGEISTYRPGHNTMKNPFKRPADYYRITARPFTRYTTPSSPNPNRYKVTSGTTITRIVYPSRSTITAWKNPNRGESKFSTSKNQYSKTQSVINTTPLASVGSDIMHPDVYPEETLGMNIASTLHTEQNIIPDKVHKPVVYSTIVHQTQSSIVNKPSPIDLPPLIQASENYYNENILRKTDSLIIAPTIKQEDVLKKPIKTIVHKFPIQTIPTSQSALENDVTVKPIHHAGNEIKQSDEDVKNLQPTIAITFTTTIAQPPSTVMTTRFVTLTHTLTVTQTQTSVVTPEVGSTTETVVLTNTHTSTVVDIVTEIHTLVQPTTIVQTITKHIPITTSKPSETKYPKYTIEPTRVRERPMQTKEIIKLDDVSLTSDEEDLIIAPGNATDILNNEKTHQEDNDTFFVVMNKSQSGGSAPTINTVIDDLDSEEPTRNEEVGNDGVSHVLLGEILLAGSPYLETSHIVNPTGIAYGKDCQPDCKASKNERCQRMHGIMKCVCRPGFARMFPDRPCKPTYTYSMKMALSRYGHERLFYQDAFADQNTKEFQDLALAAHEGINRMVMQSDLRDVYHGVHINGFLPVKIPTSEGVNMNGVLNDFYVQLSDNAHETRLKEVIEKYLRHNNYSLGGTDVYAAGELMEKLQVGDFNECMSVQFHDCSEHAECFNLRATYTCSCKEGFADLSVNHLYPGRICSAEPVGCEKCNYHGTCYTRDDSKILCECFQWYAGESCHVNLKVILISLATLGAILLLLLLICIITTCARKRSPRSSTRSQAPPTVISSCIGNLPAMHPGVMQASKMHATIDKRALIQERGNDSGGEGSSIHNVSLPYIPAKKISQSSHKQSKKMSLSDDASSREKKPFTLMIPRAKYHPPPNTSHLMMANERDNGGNKRKSSGESSNETKLLSYLDAGPGIDNMSRRKPSNESSYSMNKSIQQKYSTGALISAGFKVSTTVMGGIDHDSCLKEIPDDSSSIDKNTLPTLDMQSQFNSLRKAYSQEDINDWTDAERRIGELTMSEARSFDGTLVKPSTKLIRSTTGSNKSSAHYTQHEANTMAERDLGSTFLLPHVHLYKPDLGSDVSEFDSL